MAASWLRISELGDSFVDVVCIVARIQSINSMQRTFIIYDDVGDDNINGKSSSSSTVHVSLSNLRTSFDLHSLAVPKDQFVQVYGRVIRQGGDSIRIDAQLIRKLGNDFDMKEYVNGLIITRNFMNNVDSHDVENEGSADNSGNPIHTIL